jgi:hypothetical protein
MTTTTNLEFANRDHAARLLATAMFLTHEEAAVAWAEGDHLHPSPAHGRVAFRFEADANTFWTRYAALCRARGWKP